MHPSEDVIVNVELLSILSSATEKTQKPFLKRSVDYFERVVASNNPTERFKNSIKLRIIDILSMANREAAYALLDYLFIILIPIDEEIKEKFWAAVEWNNTRNHFMPRGQVRDLTDAEKKQNPAYIAVNNYSFPTNCVDKLIHFIYLQLMFDLHTYKIIYEHISPLINKLQSKTKDLYKVFDFHPQERKIFAEGLNFVVVNLNDVNLDIKKTLPLILSKHIYDDHKSSRSQSKERYLNIIIDEAHNILSYSSERENETWKDYRLETFEEIIKEGRKFGVFLTVASQRPSDMRL